MNLTNKFIRYNIKREKGLSSAVTALILIIAVVITALVSVGYVFGLYGAYAGMPKVYQAGTGYIIAENMSCSVVYRGVAISYRSGGGYVKGDYSGGAYGVSDKAGVMHATGTRPMFAAVYEKERYVGYRLSPGCLPVYIAVINLESTGNAQIIGANIASPLLFANTSEIGNIELHPGINLVIIAFPIKNQLSPGSTYTIVITLSNSETVLAAVEYKGTETPNIEGSASLYGYGDKYYGLISLWDNENQSTNITAGEILGTSVYLNSSNIYTWGWGQRYSDLNPYSMNFLFFAFTGSYNFKDWQTYTLVLLLSNGELLILQLPYYGRY